MGRNRPATREDRQRDHYGRRPHQPFEAAYQSRDAAAAGGVVRPLRQFPAEKYADAEIQQHRNRLQAEHESDHAEPLRAELTQVGGHEGEPHQRDPCMPGVAREDVVAQACHGRLRRRGLRALCDQHDRVELGLVEGVRQEQGLHEAEAVQAAHDIGEVIDVQLHWRFTQRPAAQRVAQGVQGRRVVAQLRQRTLPARGGASVQDLHCDESMPMCNAPVPLDVAIAWRTPRCSRNCRSNRPMYS